MIHNRPNFCYVVAVKTALIQLKYNKQLLLLVLYFEITMQA